MLEAPPPSGRFKCSSDNSAAETTLYHLVVSVASLLLAWVILECIARIKSWRRESESESEWVVPFSKHFIAGNELVYVSKALNDGSRSQGKFAEKCQEWLKEQTAGKEATY